MVDDDTRTTRRRRPEPASQRTLRAWRRTGLVLGTSGAVLMVAGALTGLVAAGTAAVLVLGAGSLCALGAVVFLDRVWSEPRHPRTRLAAAGRRLAMVFWGLWSLAVFFNVLRVVFEVGVPTVVQGGVGLLLLAAFLALLVVAFRIPAMRES